MLNSTLSIPEVESFFDPMGIEERYQTKRNFKRGKKVKKNVNSIVRVNRPEIKYNLKTINPITNTQKKVYHSYYNSKLPVLYGCAGTGKTFVALYLAMKDVLDPDTPYTSIKIIRSCVPTRNTGFLPGSQKEKEAIYETPYIGIFTELFGKNDAYEHFKKQGKVEFTSTSYLRGTTFRDTIIIFDEFQSTTFHEFSSVITRIGENCRIVVCGDLYQNDLTSDEKNDAISSLKVLNKMKSVDMIKFEEEDIVRSGIVKEFIIAAKNLFST